MKYNQDDFDLWVDLYVNKKMSIDKIVLQVKASKRAIHKKLKELGLTRTLSESQKGRVPYNKGQVGQQIA